MKWPYSLNTSQAGGSGAVNRHDGQWLAGVTVYGTDASGTNSVEIDMLVTADAITESPAT
ncbi:hypothetical protein F6X56_28955 [Rhodococcus erythropolis]|nr:hypothetical protein ABM90_27735 [Rhodococcus erythropolis]QEX13468.1 hypothetical protein F6X56_28955 [Rhodococcus erythropolis]